MLPSLHRFCAGAGRIRSVAGGEPLLFETNDDADQGRVSKGAAWGMLCKLYLFEDKFQQAITYGSDGRQRSQLCAGAELQR
jgi:hypothetical protein